MLAAVQTQHRALLEVTQLKWAQLHPTLTTQHRLCLLTVGGGDKGHRGLQRQAQATGALVGGQPELDTGACRCVAPMPGQDKALL
ncbi:hypothetical protein D3C77_593490 [compost metagenome]